MRVLHVLHTSVPALAAGYSVRADYVMRVQREQGLEPAAVTSAQHQNGETLHEIVNGFAFWRTESLERRMPVGLRELTLVHRLSARVRTAIREFRPAVVHAHSPMLVGIPALLAARSFGLPFVYELRDLWENPSVDRGKLREGSALYRAAQISEDYVLHRADALVTICQTLKDAILPRKGEGVPVYVVDNGVDADRFAPRPANESLRARWKLQGKRVVVYLGTFQPYEGVELLVRSIEGVARRVPEAHLLIVGGGGEQPRLVQLARELGLDRRVTFTGRVPHEEVADLFPLGDLFVYPRLLTRTTALTTPAQAARGDEHGARGAGQRHPADARDRRRARRVGAALQTRRPVRPRAADRRRPPGPGRARAPRSRGAAVRGRRAHLAAPLRALRGGLRRGDLAPERDPLRRHLGCAL